MFIKHVLGVNQDHPGLYARQLHTMLLLNSKKTDFASAHASLDLNSLSPQEIRDQIMDPNSDFQKKIVEYLESVHVGEFMTGTMDEVKNKLMKI